jgi:recombination protein U
VDVGKEFEKDFKDSFKDLDNISLDRLYDPVGGAKGIKNICDFIVYKNPYIYYFELKTTKEKLFPFSRITDRQYDGLKSKAPIDGAYAGPVINFREFEETYFIPIEVVDYIKENGKLSINIEEARKYGVALDILKKRIKTYLYAINYFLDKIPFETLQILEKVGK